MVLPDPAGAATRVTGRSTPASSSSNSRGRSTTRPGMEGATSLLASSGIPVHIARSCARRRSSVLVPDGIDADQLQSELPDPVQEAVEL